MPHDFTTIMAPASTCIACGQPPRSAPDALQQQVAALALKLHQAERTLEEYASTILTAQSLASVLGQLAHEWISVACRETANAKIQQKGTKAQGVLTGLGILPAAPLSEI